MSTWANLAGTLGLGNLSGTTSSNAINPYAQMNANGMGGATITTTDMTGTAVPGTWQQIQTPYPSATEPVITISAHNEVLGRLIEMQKKYIERVEYENTQLKSENAELKATLNNP